MKAIAFSPAAEADMEAIWDYSVSHWGPDQADRYVDDIRDTCRSLAMEIKRGRVVDGRRGYLKMSSGSHMIFSVMVPTGSRSSVSCTAGRMWTGTCECRAGGFPTRSVRAD